MRRKSIVLVLFTGVMLGCSFSLACCAKNSNYQAQALAAYNQGNFALAARYFKIAIARNPADQRLCYYLANSLALSGQHPQALVQYQAAYRLNNRGVIAAYCQQAISAYSGQKSNGSAVLNSPDVREFERKTLIERAKAQLTQEGQQRREQIDRDGTQSAKGLNELGERQAQTIQTAADQTMQAMRDAVIAVPDGEGGVQTVPAFSEADIASVQQRATEEIGRARAAAAYDAGRRRELANALDNGVEDSASGLITQFTPNAAGFSLAPQGTNLNIRNYMYSPPSNSALDSNQKEMVATPGKLILDPHRSSKSAQGVTPSPLAARSGALPFNGKAAKPVNADLRVHGRLIKQLVEEGDSLK